MTSPLITAAIACEEAKEGSESLDLTVYSALFPEKRWATVPRLTRSLDAIAALTAELLPGWWFTLSENQIADRFVFVVGLRPKNNSPNITCKRLCATEPLARCAALLRALEERNK